MSRGRGNFELARDDPLVAAPRRSQAERPAIRALAPGYGANQLVLRVGILTRVRVGLHAVLELEPRLVTRWHELADRAIEPNPFFAPEMAQAAARWLPGGTDDRLLTVHDGDELVLAVPVRQHRGHRRVPVPVLVGWGHRHCYLGTPLVAPDDPAGAVGAALDALRTSDAAWLVLEAMSGEGPVRAAFGSALAARRLRPGQILAYRRPVVRRRPEPTYLNGRLSAWRRKELRRQRRRLSAELGAEVATTEHSGASVDTALDELLALEAAGWKGRAGTALTSDTRDAAFFRASIEGAAREGRARVWALSGAGEVVAGACGVVSGSGLFHLKIAHDERWSRWSPGVLLELDLLDAFHADPELAWIDSCTASGASPSAVLYPDRRAIETMLVPLGPPAGRLAARGLALAHGLARGPRRNRAR